MTVTGINDGEEDGAKGYAIVLERAQSRDRFYDGFDPDDVSLTNRDNDPEPDSPLPDDPGPPGEKAGLGGLGCAIASQEQARNTPGSGALNLFLVASLLLFAVPWKGLLKEG